MKMVAVFVLALLAAVARGAGIREIEIPAAAGQPTIVAQLWTPCATSAADLIVNRGSPPTIIRGVNGCALPRESLPLVLISHGMLEDRFSHHDTAEFLADAGFAVIALNHTQDAAVNIGNKSVEDISSLLVRPVDIKRVIDFVLAHPPAGLHIDGDRIGFFGFSRGGYTGLVLAGAVPDFYRLVIPCPEKYLMCRQIREHKIPPRVTGYEPRIKAYAIADPVDLFPTRSSLRNVTAPVQLWSSEHGGMGIRPEDVSAIEQNLPVKPDFRPVAGAGHLSFDCPCSPDQMAARPSILVCTDPPGFNRAEFHKGFNAGMLDFFRANLSMSRSGR